MELGEYLAALRRRWIVIVLLALLGGAAGYLQASSTAPTYRSSSSVYLSLTHGSTVSEFSQGATYAQNVVQSFVQLARMPVVLQPVVDELQLDTTATKLASQISTDSPLNTMIIEISAVSRDSQRAADIANSVAKHLAQTLPQVSPTSEDGVSSLKMTVIAPAEPPIAPFAPRPRLMAAAGAAVGALLAVLVALALAQLDTLVRTATDLPMAPARTILGQVPHDRSLARRPRAVLDHPHSPIAESYRRLRTNLQFLDASRRLRSFVITSSVPGEGKSTTSVNLALVMAEKGMRVLLVDADLRSPSIADICGLEGGAGLSAVLIHEAVIDDVAQPWGVPGLHVMTAGQIPPNPTQLIDSESMTEFLRAAGAQYDMVILDTPPLLAVTDAAVLAHLTDGALLVVGSRKVKKPDLQEALDSLDAASASVLGILVNGVARRRKDVRYGYGQTPARRAPFRRMSRHARQASRSARQAATTAREAGPLTEAKGLWPLAGGVGEGVALEHAGSHRAAVTEHHTAAAPSSAPTGPDGQDQAGQNGQDQHLTPEAAEVVDGGDDAMATARGGVTGSD
ncbi:MAG TPA: polysaccharide biosynthesis tyrosine autokinase [Actinotalea sp.]